MYELRSNKTKSYKAYFLTDAEVINYIETARDILNNIVGIQYSTGSDGFLTGYYISVQFKEDVTQIIRELTVKEGNALIVREDGYAAVIEKELFTQLFQWKEE